MPAGLRAVDLPHESAEDFAGADLNELDWAFGREQAHGFQPADGACDLANQRIAQCFGAHSGSCVHVDDDRVARIREVEPAQNLAVTVGF